jgi:aminoglycoside phosphotransferase (APT) family kinase protein
MTVTKMHADEVATDADLIRRLLAAQFPDWAELPIAPVASAGTDNALYRLGDDLAVRMPRIHWAVGQVEKEARWLPELAPRLPLAIPAPLAVGEPGEGYPWRWGVYRWLVGDAVQPDRIDDPVSLARDLGRFVRALHAIDASGGPAPDSHNSGRGRPLIDRDDSTRTALESLRDEIDVEAATALWDAALAAPAWNRLPVWVHGDLQAGNLLATGGRLSAVIDFGCLGAGDPAVDLLPAWNLFSGEAREAFRAELNVDDATWARGQGWALSVAAIALPYYRDSNPMLADSSRRVFAALLT